MKRKTVLILIIACLFFNAHRTWASTANLSVFSGRPAPEINATVSRELVRLADLSGKLAQEDAQIKALQKKQAGLQKELQVKQNTLGRQLALSYVNQPQMTALDVIFNARSFFDLLNRLDLLHFVIGKTADGIKTNRSVCERLLDEQKSLAAAQQELQQTANQMQQEMGLLEAAGVIPKGPPQALPDKIKYRDISPYYGKLADWLKQKNSLEAGPEYLAIVNAAGKRWGVDPLLLIAITGQEQGFVPAGNGDAAKIINNPWNVFHSWQEFQCGYGIAALWAANTVGRLARGCPAGDDLIHWINGFGTGGKRDNPGYGYADDPGWWTGVDRYYVELKQVCGMR
ncbi:coiled-coil domain-containing protein [Desulfotomaculum copahuensis]|uniref:coiled-coil domain-containing protein n=1 Tax=Desulfotomaculum copahuensis TaxID=1838280 RepID=UPI001245C979|nr:hypothetical protein [Desulfotomaculum copahuensis]